MVLRLALTLTLIEFWIARSMELVLRFLFVTKRWNSTENSNRRMQVGKFYLASISIDAANKSQLDCLSLSYVLYNLYRNYTFVESAVGRSWMITFHILNMVDDRLHRERQNYRTQLKIAPRIEFDISINVWIYATLDEKGIISMNSAFSEWFRTDCCHFNVLHKVEPHGSQMNENTHVVVKVLKQLKCIQATNSWREGLLTSSRWCNQLSETWSELYEKKSLLIPDFTKSNLFFFYPV